MCISFHIAVLAQLGHCSVKIIEEILSGDGDKAVKVAGPEWSLLLLLFASFAQSIRVARMSRI